MLIGAQERVMIIVGGRRIYLLAHEIPFGFMGNSSIIWEGWLVPHGVIESYLVGFVIFHGMREAETISPFL